MRTYRIGLRKARKEHECRQCEGDIESGTVYLCQVGFNKAKQTHFNLAFHMECFEGYAMERFESDTQRVEANRYRGGRKELALDPHDKAKRRLLMQELINDLKRYKRHGKDKTLTIMADKMAEIQQIAPENPVTDKFLKRLAEAMSQHSTIVFNEVYREQEATPKAFLETFIRVYATGDPGPASDSTADGDTPTYIIPEIPGFARVEDIGELTSTPRQHGAAEGEGVPE